MQSSERQFHLGLDARDLGHSEPSSLPGGVPDEGRLADPGLTAYDQDRALAPVGSLEQPVNYELKLFNDTTGTQIGTTLTSSLP